MGVPLTDILAERGDEVAVTSRRERKSERDNLTFVHGNARDNAFMKKVFAKGHYDVIVDFMSYGTAEFTQRYKMMLDNTGQYVFISSARVFAESKDKLREDSPRLLDVCKDEEYLKTDEYALAKAREENLLRQSGKENWTIVRPSVTYNDYRLQMGAFDKEGWLYRALHGRSIVISRDVADKKTAMTYGGDVAKGIAAIIGQEKALARSFNITSDKAYTWQEILEFYLQTFEEVTGKRPKVVMGDTSVKMKDKGARYQILYARSVNRSFDNSMIREFVDADSFEDPKNGLKKALANFLKAPRFASINWRYEAWNDIETGERTPLSEIPTWGAKAEYFFYRNHMPVVYKSLRKIKTILK